MGKVTPDRDFAAELEESSQVDALVNRAEHEVKAEQEETTEEHVQANNHSQRAFLCYVEFCLNEVSWVQEK